MKSALECNSILVVEFLRDKPVLFYSPKDFSKFAKYPQHSIKKIKSNHTKEMVMGQRTITIQNYNSQFSKHTYFPQLVFSSGHMGLPFNIERWMKGMVNHFKIWYLINKHGSRFSDPEYNHWRETWNTDLPANISMVNDYILKNRQNFCSSDIRSSINGYQAPI